MMTPDSFAGRLWEAAPTRESLVASGSPPEFVERFIGGYMCKRVKPESEAVFDDPLLRLVDEFDTSTLEIGFVRFLREVEERGNDHCIGEVEADPILVDRNTGRVRNEEFGASGHVFCYCAASGEQFLEALLLVAAFLGKDFIDDEDPEFQPRAHHVASKCAEAAGGNEYHGLYYMLVGCEDIE